MSIKSTLAEIKAMGMHARYKDGEYRVTYPYGSMSDERREDNASYTNDAADAIGTAHAMQDHFARLTPGQRANVISGKVF